MIRSVDVVVCIPTRGLLFTEVMASVLEEIESSHLSCRIILKSGVPTPKVFNDLTKEALSLHPKAIWFVEEDTVPPEGSLERLYSAVMSTDQVGASCVEYPVPGDHSIVVHLQDEGTILYCGLGCTMIKVEVFSSLSLPYFRADMCFSLTHMKWEDCVETKQYGLYDVLFFTRMRSKAFDIVQVTGEAKHLKVKESYTPQENGSTITIIKKAEQCDRSILPVDPVLFWTERT